MSIECSDCESDARRGHFPSCRWYAEPGDAVKVSFTGVVVRSHSTDKQKRSVQIPSLGLIMEFKVSDIEMIHEGML